MHIVFTDTDMFLTVISFCFLSRRPAHQSDPYVEDIGLCRSKNDHFVRV